VETSEYQRLFDLEDSHFWYRGLHALVLATLRRELGIPRPEILDAGCGTGGLAVRMAALGRVTALDWSAHAVDFAGRRGLPRLLRGSVEALPFADARFDAVVSCDVLYHRAVADDGAALAELCRALRPGGLLLLNLPAHAWLAGRHDRQVHTARRYTRAGVGALAARSGLRVMRLAWFNCAPFPAAAAVRLLTRGGTDRASDVRALPAALNARLAAWMELEARAACRGWLPWGLSVFAVLRKPD
jgi:SAM-dependent methyltransferase